MQLKYSLFSSLSFCFIGLLFVLFCCVCFDHFCRVVRSLQLCTTVARSACFPSSASGISARTGSSSRLMHLKLFYGRLSAIYPSPSSIPSLSTNVWPLKLPEAAWLARSALLLFPISTAARSVLLPRKVSPENGVLFWICLLQISTVSTTVFLKTILASIYFR